MALLGLGIYATSIEPAWIRAVSYEVPLRNLAPAFDGFTILHLSDLHGRVGVFSYLRRHRLAADLIVVTGDLYSWGTLPRSRVAQHLDSLSAPDGVYYVSGNHDYTKERLATEPWAPGARLLDNRAVRIARGPDGLWLAGIPDLVKGQPQLAQVAEALGGADEPCVLLSHRPDAVLLGPAKRFGLILSGHTHGGQVTFFGRWVPVRHTRVGNHYAGGMCRCPSGPVLITSRGLGASELPVRFGARPEIVRITLRADQGQSGTITE